MLDLTVIILSHNTKKLTLNCLGSLFKYQTGENYSVYVVDNASTDGTIQAIRKNFPQVKTIVSQRNLGFAGGNNLALKKVCEGSKYVLLLNSDTIFTEKIFEQLIETAEQRNYSISSCKLVDINQQLQPNAGELPRLLPLLVWLSGLDDVFRKLVRIPSYQERNRAFYKGTKRVGWISGSVMLIKNIDLKKIGWLDGKIFMYGEDVDYCWRAKEKGLKIGWTDKCEVMHLGGGSSTSPRYTQWLGEFQGLLYLYRKHYGRMSEITLKNLIRFFVLLRIVIFGLLGKKEVSLTYAKVLKNI